MKHVIKIKKNEKWKRVILNNIKTNYDISNLGRLRNHDTKKILKLKYEKSGYVRYGISINGKKYFRNIHQLVATAFIPNPKNKPVVNHKDGNKSNNNLKNLEWCTRSENDLHAFKLGLRKPLYGENNGMNKYKIHLIIFICEELANNKTNKQILKKLLIKKNTKKYKKINALINNIKFKKNWKHISKKYF